MSVASRVRINAGAATTLVQTLVAGLVSGFLAIVLSIGFANLLLSGDLRVHTPIIVGMALFSTMVLNVVGAWASPMRGGVSCFQEVPIVAMSATAAAIAASMAGHAADSVILATIIAACMVSTTLAGVLLFALGAFRLGGLIRFVPYPVVGGFLAGTGWLILQGGVTVILGAPLTIATLGALADPGTILKGAVALVLIAIVVFLGTQPRQTVLVPVAVLAALLIYNAAVLVSGIPTETLRAAGWLVPLPPDGKLWPPLTPAALATIDWGQVAGSLLAFPGLIIVSVMALLMNATGIELDRGHDGDLDGELRAIGLQNIVAGPTGGLMGYPALSLTLLATRLGASNRGVPLVVAALCAAAILAGDVVLGIVPTPILGGLLVWMGGSLIVAWLGSYGRLALGEYLIVVLIFLVIAIAGFTAGILFGLFAAIALFVIEYSRTEVVRNFVRGDAYHSNVEASEERHAALREHGGAIRIFRLQGFLFFGTADSLRHRIVAEMRSRHGDAAARFVVLDFQRVTGIDSSAVSSFTRLAQLAARDDFTIVISGAEGRTRAALERSGATAGRNAVRFEPNVEQGLAWCESALLDLVAPTAGRRVAVDLTHILADITGSEADGARLAALFERRDLDAGAVLIEEGSASDDIFILQSGRVSIAMRGHGDTWTPLATVGPGAIVGEVAFYRSKPRTAQVTAERPTVVWRFTRTSLDRLEDEAPEVAARFHQGLARLLAERLARTDRLLAFLVD